MVSNDQSLGTSGPNLGGGVWRHTIHNARDFAVIIGAACQYCVHNCWCQNLHGILFYKTFGNHSKQQDATWGRTCLSKLILKHFEQIFQDPTRVALKNPKGSGLLGNIFKARFAMGAAVYLTRTLFCVDGWKAKLPPHAQLGMETDWLSVATLLIECCLLLCHTMWYVFGKNCFPKRKLGQCVVGTRWDSSAFVHVLSNILHPESTHKISRWNKETFFFQLCILMMHHSQFQAHLTWIDSISPPVHWTGCHTACNSKNKKKLEPHLSLFKNYIKMSKIYFVSRGWNYMSGKKWQKDPMLPNLPEFPTYPNAA